MEWVTVVITGAVLVVGMMGVLLHRRLDKRFRDVAEARRQLAEFAAAGEAAGSPHQMPPERAASAAVAAANALRAAPPPSAERADKPARILHLVRDDDVGERDVGERDVGERDAGERDAGERDAGERDVGETAPVPDVAAEPGVVATAAGDRGELDADLLARLGVGPAEATILQFSSAFCAPCRAVRRVSAEVAALLPTVQHVEVDAESHLAEVRELDIQRTPTLLLLDARGRVVKRATGVPSKPQLVAALAEVLAG
jgi:thiol-disulfide isomerase/thioredoxin